MAAIRIAIEEPPPVASAAQAVATSLDEALGILSRLVSGSGG
jgi:hypothetical protein